MQTTTNNIPIASYHRLSSQALHSENSDSISSDHSLSPDPLKIFNKNKNFPPCLTSANLNNLSGANFIHSPSSLPRIYQVITPSERNKTNLWIQGGITAYCNQRGVNLESNSEIKQSFDEFAKLSKQLHELYHDPNYTEENIKTIEENLEAVKKKLFTLIKNIMLEKKKSDLINLRHQLHSTSNPFKQFYLQHKINTLYKKTSYLENNLGTEEKVSALFIYFKNKREELTKLSDKVAELISRSKEEQKNPLNSLNISALQGIWHEIQCNIIITDSLSEIMYSLNETRLEKLKELLDTPYEKSLKKFTAAHLYNSVFRQ